MISSERIIGIQKIHFSQLDSTNAEAKRKIDSGEAIEGMVITADVQTLGRGQYGRTWNSEAYQNIMMSMIISPIFLKIRDQFWLNICTSLALYHVVSKYCENVSIKWPNDIYVNNKKIAGILIQNYLQGDKINFSVIGVGLNVNQEQWPDDIPNATSLKIESVQQCENNNIVDEICSEMDGHYKKLQLRSESLLTLYQKSLYRRDRLSSFQKNNEIVQGIIKGIDQIGRLLIERNNEINAYNHGEISLII